MMEAEETCWTLLQGVAAGESVARDDFGERYLPIVKSYLAARWRGARHANDLDDATQEVFFEFLRKDGALQRALVGARRGFGAYLFGVTCNVARRFESGQRKGLKRVSSEPLEEFEFAGDDEPASEIFQRGWANALIAEAAKRMREQASVTGERAAKRVELLELKFSEELPIRKIAERWGEEPAVLHHEYARARKEFRVALKDVIRFHHPGSAAEVEDELVQVLAGFDD